MGRWLLASLGVLAGLASGYGVATSAGAPTPAADTLRYLPVANEAVFLTMGARVWTLHVPVAVIGGKRRFVVKLAANGQEAKEIMTGRLPAARPQAALDVTFVIYSDNPSNHHSKVLNLALASTEFYDRRTLANPVRESNQFATPHDTGDLAKGVLIARLSSDANDDRAEFTLWVE